MIILRHIRRCLGEFILFPIVSTLLILFFGGECSRIYDIKITFWGKNISNTITKVNNALKLLNRHANAKYGRFVIRNLKNIIIIDKEFTATYFKRRLGYGCILTSNAFVFNDVEELAATLLAFATSAHFAYKKRNYSYSERIKLANNVYNSFKKHLRKGESLY